jgi:hypothetical protein
VGRDGSKAQSGGKDCVCRGKVPSPSARKRLRSFGRSAALIVASGGLYGASQESEAIAVLRRAT